MHCLWKKDKKAALDYLEEKRLQLLGYVESWEWELLERYKNGERFGGVEYTKNGLRFGVNNPTHAAIYDEYLQFADQFKGWVENQDL